jgi:tetratricopeptide (TPR) repeat protein
MVQVFRRIILLWATLCLLPVLVIAQSDAPHGGLDSPTGMDSERYRSVQGVVSTITGEPVPGARVDVATNAGLTVKSVTTGIRGEFSTEYWLHNFNGKFIATVTVVKKGYPKAHVYANYGTSGSGYALSVVLRPPQDDASLLSQADLISGLAPKLRNVTPSDGLTAKEAKNYERGVMEFLDRNRPDLAVPLLENVIESRPSCIRCRLMLGLADLSWGDWHGADGYLGDSVNEVIKNRKLQRPEPLVAYGVWLTWQHNADKAEPYFYEALKYAPNDPLALQELGRVQCLTVNWEEAEYSLKKALAAGAGPDARFLHAEALTWAGSVKDAEAEMNLYLNGRDIKKMPPTVRGAWERIQERKKDDSALARINSQDAPLLDYVHNPPPELLKVDSSGGQAELKSILGSVGKNIADLFEKFPNTSSLEKIHQEKLDGKGKLVGSLDQKFRYLCLLPPGQWGPDTDEYRADFTGHQAAPRGLTEGFMLTSGFVAAPLIFHPAFQPGSTFRLLGRQKIKGRDAYVIVFAQQPGRSRMSGSFRCGGKMRETYFQGVAWIDTSTFRILRLTTDLLTPLPTVRLQTESTNIEFDEVHFSSIPRGFWLPADVTVTLDWGGRHLRNQHKYSDFVVFNVESMQKIAKPKNAPADSEEGTEPKLTP